MAYFEEVLPEFRKGAKIRRKYWGKESYLVIKNGQLYNENGESMIIIDTPFFVNCDDWEIFQDPEQDWDYIIKNKCPCWFWNDKETKTMGFLVDYKRDKESLHFITSDGYDRRTAYQNCRPIRKDEVTFHEDKIDE